MNPLQHDNAYKQVRGKKHKEKRKEKSTFIYTTETKGGPTTFNKQPTAAGAALLQLSQRALRVVSRAGNPPVLSSAYILSRSTNKKVLIYTTETRGNSTFMYLLYFHIRQRLNNLYFYSIHQCYLSNFVNQHTNIGRLYILRDPIF